MARHRLCPISESIRSAVIRGAREGISVKTSTIPVHDVDQAVSAGEEEGFVRIHVRDGTDRGCLIVARVAHPLLNLCLGSDCQGNSGYAMKCSP